MAKYRDKYNRPLVAVTSMGLYSGLGSNLWQNWHNLLAGKSAIKKITRFETANLPVTIAGVIEDNEACYKGPQALSQYLAYRVIVEALGEHKKFDAPLFIALPPMELSWQDRLSIGNYTTYADLLAHCRKQKGTALYQTVQNNHILSNLKKIFGFAGAPILLTTACASGASVINMALNSIRYDKCRKAMVVAADRSITPELITRFFLLGALTMDMKDPAKASRPFNLDRSGFVMAEGAGALVLERLEDALAENKKIWAIISGGGEVTDNYHRTRTSPDNKAALKAIELSLVDAGLKPEQIDHINAHATSTIENDKAEYQTLRKLFDGHLDKIQIAANKAAFGHSLSAAGAIEAIISILTLNESIIPPTINYDKADPNIKLNIVSKKTAKEDIRHVLSNSFGFGGQNSCLIFSKFEN